MRYFLLIMFFVVNEIQAQNPNETEFLRRMDKGEELMESGRHEEAQEEFLFVLTKMSVLPANLAYLFGRNSYHLGQYKQSINWLNKYLQLKGTSGSYYEDAVAYLQRAEKDYLNLYRNNQNQMDSVAYEIFDCGGYDKMQCPVCKGSGVVIKRGFFDFIYKTCPLSNGEGYISCDDYNRFIRGEIGLE